MGWGGRGGEGWVGGAGCGTDNPLCVGKGKVPPRQVLPEVHDSVPQRAAAADPLAHPARFMVHAGGELHLEVPVVLGAARRTHLLEDVAVQLRGPPPVGRAWGGGAGNG